MCLHSPPLRGGEWDARKDISPPVGEISFRTEYYTYKKK